MPLRVVKAGRRAARRVERKFAEIHSILPNREEFLRLVHPKDRDRFNERIDKAFREKADFVQDYKIVLNDGTVKHIHGIGHPILDETGNIIEYVGTDVDVTERKRAEEALRESEASLLEAQRLTRTCSWKHEVLSNKSTVSPEGLGMFGIEPEEDASTADFYFRRMHSEDRPKVEQAYAAAVLGKTDFAASRTARRRSDANGIFCSSICPKNGQAF